MPLSDAYKGYSECTESKRVVLKTQSDAFGKQITCGNSWTKNDVKTCFVKYKRKRRSAANLYWWKNSIRGRRDMELHFAFIARKGH